jgi:polyisoprenoid-binding protein YceI
MTLLALMTAQSALAAGVTSRDPARMPAGDYVLDKSHASLVARVSHMGFSRYTLRFTKLDAAFTYDPAAPDKTRITVSVDPTGLDTGSPGFSKALANGATWLNAGTFPKITFTSTGVTPGPEGAGQVTGDLTFLGITRPLILDVHWNGVGSGLFGGTRTGFSATAHLKRSDFGNRTDFPVVGDDVDFEIEVEFFRT